MPIVNPFPHLPWPHAPEPPPQPQFTAFRGDPMYFPSEMATVKMTGWKDSDDRNAALPEISAWTSGAEMDEAIILAGKGFASGGPLHAVIWCQQQDFPEGQFSSCKVYPHTDSSVTVTTDEYLPEGVFCLWVCNDNGWSNPVLINRPALWWCNPSWAFPGATLDLFGRELTRLPDNLTCDVFLENEEKFIRLPVISANRYRARAVLPEEISPGCWKLWLHPGYGGSYGWSQPLSVTIVPKEERREIIVPLQEGRDAGEALASAIRSAAGKGSLLRLPAGHFPIARQLEIPANVVISGAGPDQTFLDFSLSPEESLLHFRQPVYGHPSCGKGDFSLTFTTEIPQPGSYEVWIRYSATRPLPQREASVFKNPAKVSLSTDNAEVWENVYATGLGRHPYKPYFRWARLGRMDIPSGKTSLTFQKSGSLRLCLDAVALTSGEWKAPSPGTGFLPSTEEAQWIVLQGNDFASSSGQVNITGDYGIPAVWITGDNAGIEELTISAGRRTDLGVAVGRPHRYPKDCPPLRNTVLKKLHIRDIDGKDWRHEDGRMLCREDGELFRLERAGIFVRNAYGLRVEACEICAQIPIMLRGLTQGRLLSNRLIAKRAGGEGALGTICSRRQALNQTVIADNVITSVKKAGSPVNNRMIWLSVGQGSVCDNYIGGNRAEHARFGGVAGRDQNVGEAILLETGNGCAYYGHPDACAESALTVSPEKVCWHLADEQNDGPEAVPEQSFAAVLSGKGLGQVRRVTGYDRETGIFQLSQPFTILPDHNSRIFIGPLFSRNIIHQNEICNGMSGIQLWINGSENLLVENSIRNMRGTGIFVYGCFSRAEENQEPLFNSGIGPEFFNLVEGNEIENTGNGILILGRNFQPDADIPSLEKEWNICLGNIVRSNTIRNVRKSGIAIGDEQENISGPNHAGTCVEFNYVADARKSGISVAGDTENTVVRQNHIYCWHTNGSNYPAVSFHKDAFAFSSDKNEFESNKD